MLRWDLWKYAVQIRRILKKLTSPGLWIHVCDYVSLAHVSRDCPFNLCVPVVLLRPYSLSYARLWHGFDVRDRHCHSRTQTMVAGAVTQNASPKLQQMSHTPYWCSVTSSASPLKYGPRPVFKVFWPVAILLYGQSQIALCSSLPGPFRELLLILLFK